MFGSSHVVLLLLQAEVMPPDWVEKDVFLAGYGAAQAAPGPLFTFVAYLGAVMAAPPQGWAGALICLGAIFAPSFLLVAGVLPFWESVRRLRSARKAMCGVNAAVVGLLLAALYDPIWTGGVRRPSDFALALAAFTALAFWKLPPWLVVVLGALGGWVRERLRGNPPARMSCPHAVPRGARTRRGSPTGSAAPVRICPLLRLFLSKVFWCAHQDSNLGPTD